jgi:hypothetical protein
MKKTEVYSWRVSAELKGVLEEYARRERTSLAQLLEGIVTTWLKKENETRDEEREQQRIREQAMTCVGSVALGQGPYTAERVRERVRRKVAEPHATSRTH